MLLKERSELNETKYFLVKTALPVKVNRIVSMLVICYMILISEVPRGVTKLQFKHHLSSKINVQVTWLQQGLARALSWSGLTRRRWRPVRRRYSPQVHGAALVRFCRAQPSLVPVVGRMVDLPNHPHSVWRFMPVPSFGKLLRRSLFLSCNSLFYKKVSSWQVAQPNQHVCSKHHFFHINHMLISQMESRIQSLLNGFSRLSHWLWLIRANIGQHRQQRQTRTVLSSAAPSSWKSANVHPFVRCVKDLSKKCC